MLLALACIPRGPKMREFKRRKKKKEFPIYDRVLDIQPSGLAERDWYKAIISDSWKDKINYLFKKIFFFFQKDNNGVQYSQPICKQKDKPINQAIRCGLAHALRLFSHLIFSIARL